MGRGARGGGGLRAGPGADAWLRGVRFWRGLARIHSVNRELETVWPDGFQLRLTPTSASAAHAKHPCWHGFAPHLGHSGATAWLPKRDRASAGTRFRHSGPRPNAAGLLRTSTGTPEHEQNASKINQNTTRMLEVYATKILPEYNQKPARTPPESRWPRQGPSGHNRRGGHRFSKKATKNKKNRPLRGAFERGISFF